MTAFWHNTSLRWCGFYLTPSPHQGAKLGWMTKRDFLVALGWGLAPIYVGEQQIKVCKTCSANPSTAKGATDAADAISLATTAGFPAGSVIYLDIETGDKVNGPVRDYHQSWVAGILAEGFLPGVYCSYVIARQLKGFDRLASVLGVQHRQIRGGAKASYQSPMPAPEPRLSGIEFSTNWQLAQGVGSVKMPGQTVAQHRFGQRQRSGSVFDCVRPDEIWPQARPTEPREFSKASSTERSTLITHETRPPHASRFRVLPNTTFL